MFFKIVFFHFCIKNESYAVNMYFLVSSFKIQAAFTNYSLYDWIVAVEIFCL